MIKPVTFLQSKILDVLATAPFPLRSAKDIAIKLNTLESTELSAFSVGASLAGLRKRGMAARRKIYRHYPRWAVYYPPGGYQEIWPYTSYWFLTKRENEVYPIKAESYFRKDMRR